MVTQFSDFVETLDGAMSRSAAPPWQQHLQNTGQFGGGVVPRPRRPSRPSQKQSQASLQELERMLDPRLTEGLQMAQSQLGSAQHEAAAVGLDDLSGDPPQGFLNTVFRGIDAPRALLFNALRTGFDPDMDLNDFREAFDAREGFGELSGLVMSEDDSGVQRFLKGAGAFAGDVATDPLMLVSFGASVVGKKLGSKAVQQAVSKRAVNMPDDVLTRFADRNLAQAARARAGEMGLSDEALAALDAAQKAGNTRGMGQAMLGDAAAEAFNKHGATGLREFMEGIGPQGRKLWESLPVDMKGGLRIRIPFSRQEGVRRAVLIAGGGGQFAQQLGLRPAVMKAHQWRNAIRASKGGQAMSRTFGGTNGDLYGNMVAHLAHGAGDDLAGTTYSMYRIATAARQGADRAGELVLQSSDATLARIMHRLETTGGKDNIEDAKAAFHRLIHDPEEFDRVASSTGAYVDDLGQFFIGENQLGAADLAGLESAAVYHHTLRDMFRQAVDAGVHIEHLNDLYLPRALTAGKKEEMAAKRVGGMKLGTVRGQDPRRRRNQFVELEGVVGEDGAVTTRMRQLSPDEANQRAARRKRLLEGEDVDVIDFFETDPLLMMSRYANAMHRIVADARFSQIIRQAGGVVEGDKALEPLFRSIPAGKAAKSLDDAQTALRQVQRPGDEQKIIERVIGDMDTLRETIITTNEKLSLNVEQQVSNMAAVVKAMDQHLSVLPKPKQAEDALKAAQRALREAIDSGEEAFSKTPVAGETSRAFNELGLSAVGVRPGEASTRKMPPELDLAFAPEQLRLAINKFYELKGPAGQNIVNRWYRPYHSMFKMTATIGRGPGFHIRNVIGGEWNNHLIGVTGEDRRQIARLVKARVQEARKAKAQVAQETIRKTGGRRVDVTHGGGFEAAVNDRTEELLAKRLGKVQVTDDLTLYDVHRLMIEHKVDWRAGRSNPLSEIEGQVIPASQLPNDTRAARAMEAVTGRSRIEGTFSGSATRMYPGQAREDLSAAQRGVERLSNLWWIRFNGGAAEMTEAYLRGGAFIQGLKRYRDPETAKLLPLATQFDYADLSKFERQWMRGGLIPFYTWTRHNIPLQLRGLFQQPGKMNRLNLLLDNAEEAFGDDDIDLLPEWMQDRFMFASRFKFDGNPLAFGIETPAQDLNEWLKVSKNPLDAAQASAKTLMSATNPVFSLPMQFLSGTEFFTGAALDEHTGRHAPWWYQRLPQSIAPTWVNDDGDIMGDGRIIVAGPGAVPWLGQSEKLLTMAGLVSPLEGRNRLVSDAVRQLFPVVTAGTMTPQGEAGDLFARARRLRTQALKYGDPEDQERVRALKDAGFTLEEISLIMEQERARRAEGGQ